MKLEELGRQRPSQLVYPHLQYISSKRVPGTICYLSVPSSFSQAFYACTLTFYGEFQIPSITMRIYRYISQTAFLFPVLQVGFYFVLL